MVSGGKRFRIPGINDEIVWVPETEIGVVSGRVLRCGELMSSEEASSLCELGATGRAWGLETLSPPPAGS
jgi:hypothetical protein